MPLTRERKENLVAEYTDLLKNSKAIILTEYRGLNNAEMSRLRNAVLDAGGVYRVAKLTLLKLALQEAGYPIPEGLSGAPLAVGFCLEEIPAVAKALTTFAQDSEAMAVRGGLMGGSYLTAAQIARIGDLPPLDTIRAQLLGLLDAPAANLVGIIQAGVAQVVNVLNAYIEQGQGDEATAAAG